MTFAELSEEPEATHRPPLDAATLVEAFDRTAAAAPDAPALRAFGNEEVISWGEYAARSRALSRGLAEQGLTRGDVVALLLHNRPEFNLVDAAAMRLGAVCFSLYPTSTLQQIRTQLAHSGAVLLVTETAFAEQAGQAEALGLTVLLVDAEPTPPCLQALHGSARPDERPAVRVEIDPNDPVCLIYTSGTTGEPKAVELNHHNLMSMLRGLDPLFPIPVGPRMLSYLPAAHVAERAYAHYAPMVMGASVTSVAMGAQVLEAAVSVRPTTFFGPPRIWEKLKAGVDEVAAVQPELATAIGIAVQRVHVLQRCAQVPEAMEEAVRTAERDHFAPLRRFLGLDAVRWAQVGAAPSAPELLRFFIAIGVPLVEMWGMSETSAISTINPASANRIGTVGQPVRGLELRVAADGELQARGPSVMARYRGDAVRTSEAFTDDGWLRTGDRAEIDTDGYVSIVGRAKELLITASGKNIAPATVEAAIKAESGLVAHACVVGDGRPYLVALLSADPDAIVHLRPEDLDRRLREAVARANSRLARPEQVKRFVLVEPAWEAGGEYVTPTLKLRREPVARDFADLIDALYAGKGSAL